MIKLNASAEFSPQNRSITINGTFLPADELQHYMIAALLDESDSPEVSVDFKKVNDVLTFEFRIVHKADVVAIGKAAFELAVAARDANTTVPQFIEAQEAGKRAQAAALKMDQELAAKQKVQIIQHDDSEEKSDKPAKKAAK